jgi:3-oxoacyl-(acyl-carrier-protein) synthase
MDDGITPTMGQKDVTLTHVLCNSLGFGGNDTSLLFSSERPSQSLPPLRTDIPIKELSRVEITDEASIQEIKDFISPLEARRMGKLLKSSLLTSLKALRQGGIERPDAIITATAMGCQENSERLLEQLASEGEVMFKPTYFMQSTHNTLSSNIAIRTKSHGYNVTFSHGQASLEWALRTARLLLGTGQYRHVLVGLHDESTPLYRSLQQRLGESPTPSIHSLSLLLTCGK